MASRTPPTETADDAPDLSAEVEALKAEVATLVSMLRKLGLDSAEAARTAARTKLAEGEAGAEKIAQEVRDEWQAVESRVLAETRANPWRSLGLAALGGLVLGLLIRR